MKQISVRWVVDYDYYMDHDCEASGCDSICRCGTIEDLEIKGFKRDLSRDSLKELFQKFSGYIPEDLYMVEELDINLYCFHRFLIHNKNFEFESEICGGYYGEELEDIILSEEATNLIEDFVKYLLEEEDLTKKINKILELEYGFILDKLEGKKVKIKNLPLSSIKLVNKKREKETERHSLYYYNKFPDLPVCIVRYDKEEYKLVDGYNRVAALKRFNGKDKKADKQVPVIVFE